MRRTILLAAMTSSTFLAACFQSIDVGSNLQSVSDGEPADGGAGVDGGPDLDAGPPLVVPPCRGELIIVTQRDWDGFQAARCTHFEGDLLVASNVVADLTTVNDALLQTVSGRLRVVATRLVTSVTFQELRSAGTVVDLALNSSLAVVNLPRLESSGRMNLVFNSALTEVNAPSLTDLGSLDFTQNDNLSVLNMPALVNVPGQITISNNARLRQCVADEIVARLAPSTGVPDSGNSRVMTFSNDGVPNVCP